MFREPNVESFLDAINPGIDCKRFSTLPQQRDGSEPGFITAGLLSKAEERYLFFRMNYSKYVASRLWGRLSGKPRDGEVRDDVETRLREAMLIRNHIVESNLRLVVSIAKRFVTPMTRLDELVSDGCLPLIRAVELFDVSRGLCFSTYASNAVRNYLGRCCSRAAKRHKREAVLDRSMMNEIVETRPYLRDPSGLLRRQKQLVRRLFDHLTSREQRILSARFGLDGDQRPHTFQEISRTLGLSKERTRQLAIRALTKLRDAVLSERLDLSVIGIEC